MKANDIKEYYLGLPPWARGIVVVGGITIVAIGAYQLFKKPSVPNNDAVAKVDNTIKSLAGKQKASFPAEMYSTFANTIHENGKYCIVGNDFDTVEATLKKMANDLDVAYLIKTFGLRQGSCFMVNTGSPLDLIAFCNTNVFSGSLDHKRADRVNEDWKKKGITYQFV